MHVIALPEPLAWGDQAELPSHAQLDAKYLAAVAHKGQLFAVTAQLGDGGAVEQITWRYTPVGEARRVAHDVGSHKARTREYGPDQCRFEGASQVFDFRELWQGPESSSSVNRNGSTRAPVAGMRRS